MQVVSNTSPIIALDYLKELHLLRELFGVTLIPPAVAREITGRSFPSWIQVRNLSQPVSPVILSASLGAGEREALTLALELEADILLDDKAARRIASRLRRPVLGTLGLLLRAKEKGLIPAIRPGLERLRALPFHISPRLHESAISAALKQLE